MNNRSKHPSCVAASISISATGQGISDNPRASSGADGSTDTVISTETMSTPALAITAS